HRHLHACPTRRSSDLRVVQLNEAFADGDPQSNFSIRRNACEAVPFGSQFAQTTKIEDSRGPGGGDDNHAPVLALFRLSFHAAARSEEHTSELQSREKL